MSITENELENARQAWGKGLIGISTAYDDKGIEAARELAEKVIDSAYGFHMGPVLFKPTLSGGEQTFRTTRKGALSYFIAQDPEYPNDGGFALRSWRKVEWKNAAHFIEGDVGIWMGQGHFTDASGNITITDKSFGYKKDENGVLRIVLHHSSLPFVAS